MEVINKMKSENLRGKNLNKILENQWIEGGIDRNDSQRYNTGVPYTKVKKSILPGLVLIASLTLAALIGTCDEPNNNSVYANSNYKCSTNYK